MVRGVVHIEPHADPKEFYHVGLGFHLRQQTAEFLAPQQQVIGPFDPGIQIEKSINGPAEAQSGGKVVDICQGRGRVRFQDQGEPQSPLV